MILGGDFISLRFASRHLGLRFGLAVITPLHFCVYRAVYVIYFDAFMPLLIYLLGLLFTFHIIRHSARYYVSY